MRIIGVGEVPTREEVEHGLQFDPAYCWSTCTIENIEVRKVYCRPRSAKQIRNRRDPLLQGAARCRFEFQNVSLSVRGDWRKANVDFDYRQYACGDEGQEADFWCFLWHPRQNDPEVR